MPKVVTLKHFKRVPKSNRVRLVLFLVAFGIIGLISLLVSRASSPTALVEPEASTISGRASVVDDPTASGGKAIQFGAASSTTLTEIRGAFYYPWFPEAWTQLGISPYTNYNPTLGSYSSTDSTVINKHIDELIYAGMNSAIYSWWGQGSKEDNRLPAYLTATGSKALKWAIYYECEGNATGGTCGNIGGPGPSAANIQNDLSYIKTKYASDPHYLQFNGKPVVFAYGDSTDSCTTSANWKTANTNLGSPFYIVLKVFSGYAGCASQPDNWHQYGPASPEDVQAGHSIAISPGFWKKGHPLGGGDGFPFLARDLARWQTNVTDLKNSTVPIKIITTFNEWGEGSAFESASEWASASGHGSYIDILHNTLVGGTTTQIPSAPANLAATAVSPTQVDLNWSASTSSLDISQYEISRNGSVLKTIPNALTYSDTTVTANTTYSYSVKAIDTANTKSGASNTVNVTTPAAPDLTPPTVPGSFASTLVSPSGNGVHLAWTASTDSGGSGLKGYVISRNGTVIASPGPAVTSFVDTTTVFSTTYNYAITALDNANNPSTAANTTITTPPAPSDTQPPDVPAANTSIVSPTQVTISWNTVADNPKTGGTASGVKGYKVFRDGAQIADVTAPSNSTNDGPFNFVAGQSYKYTVLAYDVSGNASAQSAASSVVPNPVVSSGGTCGNTATGNKIDTVIVIAEENRHWSDVGGPGFSASTMPYVHNLGSQCGFFQNDTEVNTVENSATQYVGAWTGFDASVTHVSNDCHPSASCSYTGNNIFRAFRNAGVPHREFVEGPTTTCSFSGNADKHVPDLYMFDPTDKAACASEVLPITQLNFASPPTGFSFITPNLCNDGHDCQDNSIVDGWLSSPSRLPALFNSAAYKSGKVLVDIWWDEDHPRPNLFACASCKQFNSTTDPHYSGESLLWLNLLGAPSSNLGAISSGLDMRPILGTP